MLEENATKLMETIVDNFHHDIVHYTRNGHLSMETGIYDMEHRSAQELFLRNERRTKLMEELEAKKDEWPAILNGTVPALYIFLNLQSSMTANFFELLMLSYLVTQNKY